MADSFIIEKKSDNQKWKISYIPNLGIVAQKILPDGLGNYQIVASNATNNFFTFVDNNDNLIVIYKNMSNELIAQSNSVKTVLYTFEKNDTNNEYTTLQNEIKALTATLENMNRSNRNLLEQNTLILNRIDTLEKFYRLNYNKTSKPIKKRQVASHTTIKRI